MDRLGWHDLATATQGRLQPANLWGACERIETHSGRVRSGDVFWALRGERLDGHDYIAQAYRNGAKLSVCDREHGSAVDGPKLVVDDTTAALGRLARWYRRRYEALVIGITGSVGKTTTKELVHAVLRQQFQGIRSEGNFNNQFGLPLSLLTLEAAHEFAIVELGASRRGEIRDLASIAEPEVGIITAIGKAHLESFGGVEGICQAKGELLEALPASGFAVLPGDDPLMRVLARRATCRVLFVGEGSDNDLRAEHVTSLPGELAFDVAGERYSVPVFGRHYLTNALCAIAVARELGISSELIADGLATYQPLDGRCHPLSIGPWQVIDDCYNASPTAVEAACRLLAELPLAAGGRRWLVLGDMRELGVSAAAEHAAIGRLAADLSIHGVLAFGDHAADLARGAHERGLPSGRLVATRSLDVLQLVLDCWLEPGDAILVKGSRAMRMERVIDWMRERASHLERSDQRQTA